MFLGEIEESLGNKKEITNLMAKLNKTIDISINEGIFSGKINNNLKSNFRDL